MKKSGGSALKENCVINFTLNHDKLHEIELDNQNKARGECFNFIERSG